MPKYLIERYIPGVGDLSTEGLSTIAQKSNAVLASMGPGIQWIRSFVTKDALTCEYIAPDAETIGEHARRGEFPVTLVREVGSVIDPETAHGAIWQAKSKACV